MQFVEKNRSTFSGSIRTKIIKRSQVRLIKLIYKIYSDLFLKVDGKV